MTSRLDRLLISVDVVFRLVDDEDRAAAILEWALASLLAIRIERPPSVDALGAPITVRPADVEWAMLRPLVKAVIAEIGLAAAAAQFGNSPESLRDIVNRTREPGVGRKARFLKVVVDNMPATGRFVGSSSGGAGV